MKKTILFAIPVVSVTLLVFASCSQGNRTSDQQDPAFSVADTILVADTIHNSRNTLDWQGSYTGVTPCADCEGIKVTILLKDSTYEASYLYMGKKEATVEQFSGKFTWNEEGNTITLETAEIPPYYKVGENKLIQLDMEGNLITDTQFPEAYILTKVLE